MNSLNKNIFCFTLIQISKEKVLLTRIPYKNNNKIIQEISEKIDNLINFLLINSEPTPRQTEKGLIYKYFIETNLKWIGFIERNCFCYFLLINSYFPENSALRLLLEIEKKIGSFNKFFDPERDLINYQMKIEIDKIIELYENNKNYNDNIVELNNRLEILQKKTKENIEKIIKNTEKIEIIEKKTEKMQNIATEFTANAVKYKNSFKKKDFLLCLLIIFCLATVIISLLFIIIL